MVVFQKLEGKTTTLNFWNQKNGRKFYYSQKIVFWQNFWNQKNGRKFYYSQKLCFDRIFEIKKREGNSTTPKTCVLTEFLHERSTIFFLVFSLIWFWILLRNVNCSNFCFHPNRQSKIESTRFWSFFDHISSKYLLYTKI